MTLLRQRVQPDTGSEPGPGRLASDGSRRRAFAASGPGRDAGGTARLRRADASSGHRTDYRDDA